MSEQLKQMMTKLKQGLETARIKLVRWLIKAWHNSKAWSVQAWHNSKVWVAQAWQTIKVFFRELYHQWPGWRRLFKRSEKIISPIRPDIPMVKDTAQLAETKKKPVRQKPIRRKGRQRVYRLKGYTTVAKVNRKYKSEMQQSLLRKALVMVTILLAIILLFNLYNPFTDTDMTEWYRIFGISDWSDLFKDNPLMPDLTPTPPAP